MVFVLAAVTFAAIRDRRLSNPVGLFGTLTQVICAVLMAWIALASAGDWLIRQD
jgi:hypothetical protein